MNISSVTVRTTLTYRIGLEQLDGTFEKIVEHPLVHHLPRTGSCKPRAFSNR
jgi:hypothetical protein